jgi:alkanesulfonate monooxygenase SsuD/methylene tetrahydromethanopterin reductase-like flavin-dependent oxidoreductase (luciferase family)
MVQDAASGRFILGLGVSHRPALEARGIDMGNARERLRRDTSIIRATLAGETSMFGMKFRQPREPIPIYYATLALETARLGGELADGLMLYLCPPERMRKSIDVAYTAAEQHGRAPADVVATVGLPVFLHDDLEVAYAAARRGLAFYGALPFYNRLIARSGFESAADAIMAAAKRGDATAMAAAVTEPMIDSLALVGPESRCFERLEQYRKQGADLPIIVPNAVNEDYPASVRRIVKSFAKLN